MNLKQNFYRLIPKRFRKKAKNFYYDKIIHPQYSLKYLFFYGRHDFFDSIAIETTTYCNLKCKYCPNSIYDRGSLEKRKFMKIELFKKIINELGSFKYRGLIMLHFYGEPLTDPRLPELVRYAKEKCPLARVQINTNGFLLTIPLYRKLVKNGVYRFGITQYGDSKIPGVQKVLEYLKETKEDNKIVYRVLGENTGLSNRGGALKIKNPADYERPICIYPNTAIHIDYLGNLILCCNDYHSSITFGNLEKEGLLKIWDKPDYKRLRSELKHHIFKLPICKRCTGVI